MESDRYVIYPPPEGGLPYLAVAVLNCGAVVATGFESFLEAALHLESMKSESLG